MIRPYQKPDKKNLLGILRLNTPEYFSPAEEADFMAYLADDSDNYFVVEEGGEIIGAGGINYFHEEGLAKISWDIVHPSHQGKGVGKKLTKYRINKIKENPNMNSIVVRTSQLAFKFYGKMGFELEKTEKDFWAEGIDLYQMKMGLD